MNLLKLRNQEDNFYRFTLKNVAFELTLPLSLFLRPSFWFSQTLSEEVRKGKEWGMSIEEEENEGGKEGPGKELKKADKFRPGRWHLRRRRRRLTIWNVWLLDASQREAQSSLHHWGN